MSRLADSQQKQTPMMRQYHEAKAAAGDALLLFRMGDFYELFFEDAKIAARLLGLSLTSRDKGENPIAMAGFPHHQLDSYLSKIIAAGKKAAVCEQVEDPRQAKGIVKRDITRVVSKGTVTDDILLDPQSNNFLLALAPYSPEESICGLAWIDLSTGRFEAATVSVEKVGDELARIDPVEILLSEESEYIPSHWTKDKLITKRPIWAYSEQAAKTTLSKHFGTESLEGFGFIEDDGPGLQAAGAILDYLMETQKASLAHVDSIIPYHRGSRLEIDEATRRSLEITQTLREGKRQGSLLGVLDHTVTSSGARLLGEWIANPLTDIKAIDARLDAISEFLSESTLREELTEALKQIYDMQRLLARVSTGRATPRDLSFIGRTIRCLPKVKAKLTGLQSTRLQTLENRIDLCADIRSQLEAALEDDCPLSSREGGFVRAGYHKELDEQRKLMKGGKQWMAEYQAQAMQETGIPNIKVGFNKVFGYYLEVTHANRDKVPSEFIRKQTLKNAERYITPELKEHEEKVLAAEEKCVDIEYQIFLELRELVLNAIKRLQQTAGALAEIDVLASLAKLALSRNYVRPDVVAEPMLDIQEGRHPVLDVIEEQGTFVPNGVTCQARSDNLQDEELPAIQIITGPNMAGKSTYIRQIALITLMGQMGSYVPARKATLGVADRIFARVGASDDLARGQSTFMVEMTETARILNTATDKSLVILDEIGRGTSTYDGLSLAWAVVEHLHDKIGCRTLFATHYHELTQLEDQLDRIRNLNVAVEEWNDQVVFLHKIVEGAADKSYGIHVAQLAGVPKSVNARAKQILAQLENLREDSSQEQKQSKSNGQPFQLTLFETADHPLLETILSTDLNSMSPLEVQQLVAEWQSELSASQTASSPKPK